jgi:hypothetical protein
MLYILVGQVLALIQQQLSPVQINAAQASWNLDHTKYLCIPHDHLVTT